MEFFEGLGSETARRWKAFDYDEEHFPQIATDVLSEFPPYQHVSLWDVAKWACLADHLPPQTDIEARFGDPPLTVYEGRGFRIEVLFWIEGVPGIHQHAFSGAFHVMQGRSLHTRWNFEMHKRIEARLLLGAVTCQGVEVLEQGETRLILAGDRMYHATFHLERPSVSVVVRTLSDIDRMPQYALLPPCIAHAAHHEVATVQRQIQILDMLLSGDNRDAYLEIAKHMLATKDALTVYQLLVFTFNRVEDEEDRNELLAIAKVRHRELLESLEPVLTLAVGQHRLLELQKKLTDPPLPHLHP